MLVWPGVALIGFLLLIAVVVALGIVSTNRYERERSRRAAPSRLPRDPSASPPEPPADDDRRQRPGTRPDTDC